MLIEEIESKFFKLNQTLSQICENLINGNKYQYQDNILHQIEIITQEETISQKINAARNDLLERLFKHRNLILANANSLNEFSRLKFKQSSLDLNRIDLIFIGDLKINFELSCFQKLKYFKFLTVRFIKLNDTFANKDLFDQFLLNESRLLIFSKLENKFIILSLKNEQEKQIELNTVFIEKNYWCRFNAYNNRIIVRCTDETSETIHSRLNLYNENLNLIQTVNIDEKIYSNISVISKNECCFWSDKRQKYIVLDRTSLKPKFSFGQNESIHVNDGPLEFISLERIYIRNETRRSDNKRELLLISRSTGQLVNSISCDSMNIYVKVDDSSRLFINSYKQGSMNTVECFDLNGNLLFRNVIDFFKIYNVEFSYFNFSNENIISFFNYDRKNIIFL